MTAHSKSFEQRYRELREQGKTSKKALEIIIEERELGDKDVPSKLRAKEKEGRSAKRKEPAKRSRRR